MNAIARVAIQFIKNRCRSRRSLPWIALFVAVPIFLYVLCVPNPRRDYVKLDHDDFVLLKNVNRVKLNPSVAREVLLIKELPERGLGSKTQGSGSTDTNCQQGNQGKCRSTNRINHTTPGPVTKKIGDGNLHTLVTKKIGDNSTKLTAKNVTNHKTITEGLATPKHYNFVRPQTASNSSPSNGSHSNSFPIKGLLPRILLIYDNFSIDSAKRVKVFLQTQRVDFDLYSTSKNRTPPPLSKLSTETDEVIGRYSLILCADIGILFNRVGQAERRLFYEYSRAFNISIIAVERTAVDVLRGNAESRFKYGNYLILPVRSGSIVHAKVDDKRQWLFTKGGITVTSIPRSAHWQVFLTIESQNVNKLHNDSHMSSEKGLNHLSLQFIRRRTEDASLISPSVLANLRYAVSYSNTTRVSHRTSPLVLVDHDVIPGVVTVLIGMDMRFWLTKLLLMDIIRSYSSTPLLRFDNKRWVMVDIDDIFVAPEGLRMTTSDVEVVTCTMILSCIHIVRQCILCALSHQRKYATQK